MHLELVRTAAFFDELQKISAVQDYLGERSFEQEKNSDGVPEHQDQGFVTKKKLKQLAIMLPVAAGGYALGHGVGAAGRRWLTSKETKSKARKTLGRLYQKHPTLTKALMVGVPTAGVTAAGYLALKRSKRVRDWIEGKHEGK